MKGAQHIPLSKYPFDQMQIGDAFYVPCKRELLNNAQTKIHNAARRYREKTQTAFKVSTRATIHEGQFCVATFRIA